MHQASSFNALSFLDESPISLFFVDSFTELRRLNPLVLGRFYLRQTAILDSEDDSEEVVLEPQDVYGELPIATCHHCF